MKNHIPQVLLLIISTLFLTTPTHAIDASSPTPRLAPSLNIASALKIAEEYYREKEDPKLERFIQKVHYVEYNQAQPEKGPFWVFLYVLPKNVIGGEVFVSVYMDGTTSVFHGR